MPSVDLFTIIEGFIAGVVAFFWNALHSFYALLRDPRGAPLALLKRFRNKELRQVGPFTLLFLPWFLVFFVGAMSRVDWSDVLSQDAATTVTEYRAGSQFLHAIVGATAATVLFDLWLRLFAAWDTKDMRLTDEEQGDYRALLRYIFVAPVLVLSILTLVAMFAGTALLRFELVIFLASQIAWLLISSRVSHFPAKPRQGLWRLAPRRYGLLTLLAFDVSLIGGFVFSDLSRQVEYTSAKAYPERIYLEGISKRCLAAGGRLAIEVTAFNPSTFAALVPKTAAVNMLKISSDGTYGRSTQFALQSDAKFASGEIVGPRGLVTIAYRSTEPIPKETIAQWQADPDTHCWLSVPGDQPNQAMLFGDPFRFGPPQ